MARDQQAPRRRASCTDCSTNQIRLRARRGFRGLLGALDWNTNTYGIRALNSGGRAALRHASPPPALRALVAGPARRLPSRGRVAVNHVCRHRVARRAQDRAAAVGARSRQGGEQRPARRLVHRVVAARLARWTPALARRAARAGRDASRRVAVVAGADHAAVHCWARVLYSALCRLRLDARA